MRVGAADAATDAAIVNVGYGIPTQRVRVFADSQRGAPGQADAAMIAGAGLRIDIKTGARHATTFGDRLPDHRLDPALTIQHAFAFCDHDLEPGSIARQG